MKFGTKLETFIVPEWSDKYIRYKELSRLAKRASRLKSGKIPGVEDDEEKNLLENLFTVDQNPSPHSEQSLSQFAPSEPSTPMENRSCVTPTVSNRRNVTSDCVVKVSDGCLAVPNVDSQGFKTPPSLKSLSIKTPAKEEDDHTEALRVAAYQFENEGFLSLDSLRQRPENIPHLNKLLKRLDSMETGSERKDVSTIREFRRDTPSRDRTRIRDSSRVRAASIARRGTGLLRPPVDSLRSRKDDDATSRSGSAVSKNSSDGTSRSASKVSIKAGTSNSRSGSRVFRKRSGRNSRSESVSSRRAASLRTSSVVRGTASQSVLLPRASVGRGRRRMVTMHRFRIAERGGGFSRFNLGKHTPLMQEEALSIFHKVLRDDMRVVIIHYVCEMEYIKALVRFLKGDIARRGGTLDDSYASLIRKACTAFWDSCDKLRLYLNLNTLAVYKALKKKDKVMGSRDVFNLYPTYKSILLSLDTSRQTVEEVAQIFNSLMDQPQVDFAVLKGDMEATLDGMRQKPAHDLFFIYGMCAMLFANSLFLCAYDFNTNFNLDILLSHIPTFRFFFMISLVWWGFGWCQNYLETYGVNYQFQFGISSNYAVTETEYYITGGYQTLACGMLFVMFVLDCKLHVVPEHRMYYLYPIALVLWCIVVVLLPHRNLKLKFRRRLLLAVLKVLGAPFGVGEKVTLADSIVADVLTSLTRPLRDLVYMITYFCIGMFAEQRVKSKVVSKYIVPAVMCYPYFIRFSQCLRRYINERRWMHVGNMAKYVSGILCVVVSSIDWIGLFQMSSVGRLLLVTSFYIGATLFQCWWDFVMDWGLDLNWNIFKTRQNRRMYSRQAYYVAVVFNMVCRCTWALTTMPFAIIENKELSSAIVFLLVSIIEIVRRVVVGYVDSQHTAQWVTFRLESEHLLNSYKYRTALWVPKLYNCKNLIVKEMKMLNEQM